MGGIVKEFTTLEPSGLRTVHPIYRHKFFLKILKKHFWGFNHDMTQKNYKLTNLQAF